MGIEPPLKSSAISYVPFSPFSASQLESGSDPVAESLENMIQIHGIGSAEAREKSFTGKSTVMKKTKKKSPRHNAKLSFQLLPSYRLHQLSTLSERLIGMRYREKFGLRMMEVGILIMVGNSGALSFKSTYKKANLDKSSVSRLATQLLEKGLLEKREDPADQRSFYLGLTAVGQKLYRQLYADALRRNERWMAVLPKNHRVVFLSCLETLTQHMRVLLQEEMGTSGSSGPLESRAQDGADLELPERIMLDATAASQLYLLLGAALGKKPDA
jgi:DNA-binding MarR family transcriptional regulator